MAGYRGRRSRPEVDRPEHRRQHAWEGRVGGAELGLVDTQRLVEHQVVVGTVDRPQAPGQLHIGQHIHKVGAVTAARIRNQDLLQNELEVGFDKRNHFALRFLQPAILRRRGRPVPHGAVRSRKR